MITITGLNNDIYTAMLGNAQERVIDSIMTAASQGRTSISIAKQGTNTCLLSSTSERRCGQSGRTRRTLQIVLGILGGIAMGVVEGARKQIRKNGTHY